MRADGSHLGITDINQITFLNTDLDGDAPLLGGAAEGLEGGAVEGAGRGQADGGEEERCSEHGDTRPELWQLAARSRVPSGFSDTDMLAMFTITSLHTSVFLLLKEPTQVL